ncbi:MAG: glutamate 5-kinase [Candidatus Omnitrophica bacterium]|nr:glutamate 5-kinase [Candidatus Omnitrophota bacterium]
MPRQFPRPVKRLVVKFGSSVIATNQLKPRSSRLISLINEICAFQKKGIEVVLVSSGAIVLGMGEAGLKARPKDLASLQALAAIGQAKLMKQYCELFKKHKSMCGQVLLTWDDFAERERYNNARGTLAAIMANGAVPIVNENDTISTEEIKFGDNDKLSAMVASLVGADLLILLSDVEGLYDLKGGNKKLFAEVREITQEIEGAVSGEMDGAKRHISRGGMSGKLDAIKIATKAKIPCVIANGETADILTRILQKESVGTFFFEAKEKAVARKHWILFGAKPKGGIVVDAGAVSALVDKGKSLLSPGVVACEGVFKADDVVVIRDPSGEEIGRGIVNYSAVEMLKKEDKKDKPEVIHRDDLVLTGK